MKKVIYAGSFDPVTFGHLDIIRRAVESFDHVHVVVGNNPTKKYALGLQARIDLIRNALYSVEFDRKVTVHPLTGLLSDFAFKHKVNHIIKGVRNNQDFNYEQGMNEVNLSQQRGIETHIFMSKPELAHVSSSAVKELSSHFGVISDYVPLHVKQALEFANNHIVIGLTGTIASGKSTVVKSLEDNYRGRCSNIDFDVLGHELLSTDKTPLAKELRMQVSDTFKMKIPVNRKKLGEKVFGNQEELNKLNAIFREPLLFKVREAFAKAKKSIKHKEPHFFVLNGSLLIESNFLFLCNNQVVLIYAEAGDLRNRLKDRGLNKSQIERRLESQYNYDTKYAAAQDQFTKDNFGNLYQLDSKRHPTQITRHFQRTLELFKERNNRPIDDVG